MIENLTERQVTFLVAVISGWDPKDFSSDIEDMYDEGIVWRDEEDSDYVRCDKQSVAIQDFAKKYECYTARNFPLKFNPWPPVER